MYAAGGFIYLLDSKQTLAAIHADDGLVTWLLQLPAYRNPKKKKGPRAFNGPVMVNGQLAFTTSLGELAMVDPVAGTLGAMTKLTGGPADLAPLAVGGSLLVLTRNAALTAYS
jgi:outer membrane protein assembly factor BamB